MVFKPAARPLLFLFDPERAHTLATQALALLGRVPPVRWLCRSLFSFDARELRTQVAGIAFANPIGLAAGFDKHCTLTQIVPCLGFSHMEVGTITAMPQPGNPRPRLFRLAGDRALVNRMGFNNHGAAAAATRLRACRKRAVLGANIGKSKVVPLKNAVQDYVFSFRKLYPFADYFTVNVSSPNTPGLRSLQEKPQLMKILRALQKENGERKPIFVKIAPDLARRQIDDVIAVVRETECTGIIATNTTTSRKGLASDPGEAGGLSGRPLTHISRDTVSYIFRKTNGSMPIIGVGGVFTAEDAYAMIRAGASLVQAYTGFVYEGPGMARRINKGLRTLLQRDGYASVSEAVGAAARRGTSRRTLRPGTRRARSRSS